MSIKITIEDIKQRFLKFNCTLITKEYLGYEGEYEFICNKHADKGIQKVKMKNLRRNICCHYCSIENNREARKVPEEELKAITEKAGFIYIRSELMDGKRHIIYKCPKHIDKGEQNALVNTMRRSKGNCPYCLNRKRTNDDFVKEIHSMNPNIVLLDEFKNVNVNYRCRCSICGNEWTNSGRNLLRGQGCRICVSRKNAEKTRHTQEWFDQKMHVLHPDIDILSPFVSMKEKVDCKCLIDNFKWSATPDALINGKTGCPICFNKRIGERCRKSNDDFLEELKQVNPYIIPLEKYKTDHEKILCKCLIHDYEWKVAPNKILHRKTGCPKCAMYNNEMTIASILEDWEIKYTTQKTFKNCKDQKSLPFDFYLDDYNTIIEYDGEQHFQPIFKNLISEEKQQERLEYIQKHDSIKNDFCRDNNINLIRIPFWDKDNIKEILFTNFINYGILEEI